MFLKYMVLSCAVLIGVGSQSAFSQIPSPGVANHIYEALRLQMAIKHTTCHDGVFHAHAKSNGNIRYLIPLKRNGSSIPCNTGEDIDYSTAQVALDALATCTRCDFDGREMIE